MSKTIEVNEKKSINNNILIINLLILVIAVFSVASIDTMSTGATIAYIGDAEEFGTSGIPELTMDFNQIILQSPTGNVDAVVMLGDMDLVAQVLPAYSNSTAKDIPAFYVVGNHESANINDLNMLKSAFSSSFIPLNPGPTGINKTTYSFDIGRLHIININEYWDGNSNRICDWKIPAGGISVDDACFKYSTSDGGYVPDALYNWINADLTGTSQPWKIVIGHEPLYPLLHHVGDSLDKNTTNRDQLKNLFVEKKVAVFISGHTHNSGVQLKEGIYYAAAGVTGLATTKGEDSFASLFYTHTNPTDDLILTWKHENPTWATPATTSYIIKSSDPPVFINGKVMDRVSKSSIEGVKVFTDAGLSTTTDTTGFYSFSINSGTYNITAILEPAYYPNSTSVSLLGAVVVQDIELLKKPNGTITGRVSNV